MSRDTGLQSPRIQLELDVQRRRALMTMPAGLSSARLARATAGLLADDPTLATLDWIVDQTANHEGCANTDADIVLDAYLRCPRPPGRRYTCVITHDLYFSLWAVSLDLRFGDRTHKAFAQLTSATQFLEIADRS